MIGVTWFRNRQMPLQLNHNNQPNQPNSNRENKNNHHRESNNRKNSNNHNSHNNHNVPASHKHNRDTEVLNERSTLISHPKRNLHLETTKLEEEVVVV